MTAPETIEGWFALHDIRRLDRRHWASLGPDRRREILLEAAAWLDEVTASLGSGVAGATGSFALLGHKGDLMLLHLRETVGELRELERDFNRLELASCCQQPFSFLSVTELSLYGGAERLGDDPLAQPRVRRRIYPSLPELHYICFYPMDRKREGEDNWYALGYERRARLVREHGETGRKFAGRVTQLITGSVGLDDWEWGVTLFSDDALEFKKLIYEMRFDEASARFAEFGPFYVGLRLAADELPSRLL